MDCAFLVLALIERKRKLSSRLIHKVTVCLEILFENLPAPLKRISFGTLTSWFSSMELDRGVLGPLRWKTATLLSSTLSGGGGGVGDNTMESLVQNYFTIGLVVFLLGILVYKWKLDKRLSGGTTVAHFINQFPGPMSLPIFGNGHQMIFKQPGFFEWSRELHEKWGGILRLWRLSHPMIVVNSFDYANQLLSRSELVGRTQDIDLFYRLPGYNGLSSSPGHVHQSKRKLAQPGFSRAVIERSIYIFCEESKQLVNSLRKHAQSESLFNGLEALMPCAFRVICRGAFGDDHMSEITEEDALEQMHCLHTVNQGMVKRMTTPYLWLRSDFVYFNLTSEGRYMRRCLDTINRFGSEGIRKRKEQRRVESENIEKGRGGKIQLEETKERVSAPFYIDLLLDNVASGNMEEKYVLGELNNYIVAGYDSTALTTLWTLFMLALNPSHQDKICEELESVIGGKGEEVSSDGLNLTAADTKEMKHMELCVKEALRMYPTVPVFPRSTIEDIRLADGRLIPGGTDVVIMPHLIHRDPKYFPNPNQFTPERHLEPIPAFLPFSVGPRNCVGQVFAMHHVKVELAYLLREFVWETVDRPEGVALMYQGLLAPKPDIRFRIRRRQ